MDKRCTDFMGFIGEHSGGVALIARAISVLHLCMSQRRCTLPY